MDRKLYKSHMQHALHNYGPNLSIRTGSVYDLVYSHTHSGPRPEDIRAQIEGVRLGAFALSFHILFLFSFCPANSCIWPCWLFNLRHGDSLERGRTDTGEVIHCSQVVICTGTFLSGEIHIGSRRIPAGRINDPASPPSPSSLAASSQPTSSPSSTTTTLPSPPSTSPSPTHQSGLSHTLQHAFALPLSRLQTGTPARLAGHTIDFSHPRIVVIEGDERPRGFGFLSEEEGGGVVNGDRQVRTWQTFTTPETHAFVRENMHLSVHVQETKKGGWAVFVFESRFSPFFRFPVGCYTDACVFFLVVVVLCFASMNVDRPAILPLA